MNKYGCAEGPDERNNLARVAVVNMGWAGVAGKDGHIDPDKQFSQDTWGKSWEFQKDLWRGRGGLPQVPTMS